VIETNQENKPITPKEHRCPFINMACRPSCAFFCPDYKNACAFQALPLVAAELKSIRELLERRIDGK